MKNNKAKVIVVGSLNMDLVVTASRIPVPGETILGDSFLTVPGGKGNNQAIAASRLNAHVEMVGCVGRDHFGIQLVNELKKNNVSTKNINIIEDSASGVALITVAANAENSIVVASGANEHLSPTHIQKAEDLFREADVLLVQLEIPLDTVIESLKFAKKHGVITVLNPAPGQKLTKELLEYVDYITPNETEIKILLSFPADFSLTDKELESKLKELNVPNVIVTKGEEGSVLWRGNHLEKFPSYNVKALDTTAAGDSFNGAFSVALAEGKMVEEAIQFAQKVASITVTRMGSSTSLPYRDEL